MGGLLISAKGEKAEKENKKSHGEGENADDGGRRQGERTLALNHLWVDNDEQAYAAGRNFFGFSNSGLGSYLCVVLLAGILT